jgi:hypothetical protein
MEKRDVENESKYRVTVLAQFLNDAIINSGVKSTKRKRRIRISFFADRDSLEIAIADGAQKSNLIEAQGRNSWQIVADGAKISRLLGTLPQGRLVELQPKTAELVIIQGRGQYNIPAQEFSTSERPTKFKEITTAPLPKEILDRPLKSDVIQENSWGFTLQIPWRKK